MTMRLKALLCIVAVEVGTGAVDASAPPPSPAGVAFFETKIRPLLADRCWKCHGPEKQKGKLRLDGLAAIMQGGETGPAVVPGHPEKSLLIKAISHSDPELQMPPSGKLPKAQIDDLTRWVKMGAPWPGDGKAALHRPGPHEITAQDRAWWSFQPVKAPETPAVKNRDWVANPIDAFILAKLEAKRLSPNPPAERRQWIRRAYFDLIGLPPTPAEVDAFIADPSADAWERVIDGLLARPQYGERWARHWLDVVRFAQSSGYERDAEIPYAWRYRDYVVKAFNEDKPFDRFMIEQLAGDELEPWSPDNIIATGFYRLGVWDDEADDPRVAEYEELDDIIAATGQAFLGLTVQCARCHEHKFDPIPQRDYYRLLAFFHPLRGYEKPKFTTESTSFVPLISPVEQQEWRARQRRELDELDRRIGAAKDVRRNIALREQKKKLQAQVPEFALALAVRERDPREAKTHVLIRGNPATPSDEVQPGFLEVLTREAPVLTATAHGTSGRRKALAEWIASPKNPLTARVIVNRIWQHHFGRGIVPTPNDFGKTGMAPTHPELLDWLAADFMEHGWKSKRLHKLIIMSNAYRMSSHTDNVPAKAMDEGNSLFWRQNLRRLEVEAIRDSVLAVSGKLNPEMGGRGFFPRLAREVVAGQSRPGLDWEMSPVEQLHRRSLYTFIKRTMMVPMLEAFDYTNTAASLGERPVTTVAPQALILLNSDFMQDQAAAFAQRVQKVAGNDFEKQIDQTYRLAFARTPTAPEKEIALTYLRRQTETLTRFRPPLTLLPKVPASLSEVYWNQLQPTDFLDGPRRGWSYHRGSWADRYEGIAKVDARRTPFILWQGDTFADGTVAAKVTLQHASEIAGIILRAKAAGDLFNGYEVTLDPRKGLIQVVRHEEKEVRVLGQAKAEIQTRHEHLVRIEMRANAIQVWLDETLALQVGDPTAPRAAGQVGLRTWGAGLTLRDLNLSMDQKQYRLDPEQPYREDQARLKALEAFCLLVLNLNEFVYVD